MAKGNGTIPLAGTYEPLHCGLVAELAAIGYAADKIRHWPESKARLALRRYQIQANATIRRANNAAEAVDGPRLTHGPIGFLRAQAVAYILAALAANDMGDLLFAVQAAVAELSNDELKRLGDFMAGKLVEVPTV